MPVDLDELLTGLGGQADAIPLGTAERARQRGRQRTRNRAAALSAVVAVSLVLVGVAGALARTGRGDHPVSPTPSGHALPEVTAPIPFGGTMRDTWSVAAGERAYTAWQDATGTVSVIATDPRTGAVAWTARGVGRSPTLADRSTTAVDLQAVSPAVLLTVDESRGRIVYVLRPSDGRTLWQLALGETDTLIPHDRALVRWSGTSGRTEAYTWATGVQRWWLDGGDPPARTVGMRAAGDTARDSYVGDAIVRITGSGKAELRDVGTGALVHTVSIGTLPEGGGGTVLNGRLFTAETPCCDTAAYRIRATDLTTSGEDSAVVFSQGVGHTLTGLDLCGTDRLCVLDQDDNGPTTLSAIDLTARRTLWRVAVPVGVGAVSAVGDNILVGGSDTTVLYDAAGREVFRAPDALITWLTPDTLLMMPAQAEGPVVTVRVDDGRTTRLGNVPIRVGPCAHTPERLVCATATGVHFWSLTG